MDFQSSLDYLYGLQRFGVKLGLDNMRALAARLQLVREAVPCVHVAGTNGKGSVSVTLAEILKQAGLRVGLYTSPHLHCFSERIRIDGQPINNHTVARLAGLVRQAAGDIPVTFFEATTAMALLAFKEQRVDIAVMETGLGGRLDATNIIEPQLSLITPVSYDHREHLGSTLAGIAAEKAGIIKPGIPVVVGKQPAEAAAVILTTAADRGAPVLLAERDFRWQGNHQLLSVETGSVRIDGLSCALAGKHQIDNLAMAVAGAVQLREQGHALTDEAVRDACQRVVWPGRLEWLGRPGQVLFDVSHNQAGIACLAEYLAEQRLAGVHLVAGMSGSRLPDEVFMPLEKLAAAVYAVPVATGTPVPPEKIVAWAESRGLPARAFAAAGAGLATALDQAGHGATVVVCGSLYLVAELRQVFLEGLLRSA